MIARWQFLLAVLAGWVNDQQQLMIEYLREENRVLREHLRCKRIRFTDDQRRRLAAKGKALGRKVLQELGCLVTPDTILRWHPHLIARKCNGSAKRLSGVGRPPIDEEARNLIVQFARANVS